MLSEKQTIEFSTKYKTANEICFQNQIEYIKLKVEESNKEELQKIIEISKSNLENDFKQNIDEISNELDIDLNVNIPNPYIKHSEVLLLDAVIVFIIYPINRRLMESFDKQTELILQNI